MTINAQWLIFGAVCLGLFVWGYFSGNGQRDNSDAQEGHTLLRTKNRAGNKQLKPDDLQAEALSASRR